MRGALRLEGEQLSDWRPRGSQTKGKVALKLESEGLLDWRARGSQTGGRGDSD